MPDANSVVEQAIKESVQALVRGVHCANPAHPDVTIPPAVVKWLQADESVFKSFSEQLAANPDRWKSDGHRVCRAAFHAGSLAALHAYSKNVKVVGRQEVRAALEHVSGICSVGADLIHGDRPGVRWIYCKLLPKP